MYLLWCNIAPFNVDKATNPLSEHAFSHSHNCCAWFVMRAMQSGGCPAIILPAWAYRYYLPIIGWEEININSSIPQKGDVSIFPYTKNHIFGHIAMWNGEQWISDFKQKNIIVSKDYTTYRIYRKRRRLF